MNLSTKNEANQETFVHLNVLKRQLSSMNSSIESQSAIEEMVKLCRTSLMLRNMNIVYSVARKLCGNGWWYDDAVQVGFIAMMNAIDSYDPARGTLFTTFAYRVIQQRIWDDCKRPGGALDRRLKVCKKDNLDQTDDQEMISGDDHGAFAFEVKDTVEALKEELNEREALVIDRRFGLSKVEEMTLAKVALEMNVSHETVRRIEFGAMQKLKKAMSNQ